MAARNGKPESVGAVFHKEKNQKKYNKTIGQIDNLKKYGNDDEMSIDKMTSDKQIRREANYMKNLHIENCYDQLLKMNLINNESYRDWYFKCLHTLGTSFVMVQADLAQKRARDPDNPAPLFHFLINKAMNKHQDPYMPRFNRQSSND